MDAIVQFIRNALCCVKDLQLYPDSVLHQSNLTNALLLDYSGLELPEPINRTTPLEVIISVTQLYAALSTTLSGLSLVATSVGKLRTIVRLLECRLEMQASPPPPATAATTADEKRTTAAARKRRAADRVINESLFTEARAAVRGVFVGLCVAPIGVAFFWLFAHSWHVTETMWIGGIVGLIDALSVMEACLIPLLLCMAWDGVAYLRQARQAGTVTRTVQAGPLDPTTVTAVTFQFLEPGWVPFWEAGVGPFAAPQGGGGDEEQAKRIAGEVEAVERALDALFPAIDGGTKGDDDEKEGKIRVEALARAVRTVQGSRSTLAARGYREFLYFALNAVAFYGYLMAILCFYYPDDSAQPTYVQRMKLGYPNEVVDWSGNFAGDLMWTIESLVILGSPVLLTYLQATPGAASAMKGKVGKQKDE